MSFKILALAFAMVCAALVVCCLIAAWWKLRTLRKQNAATLGTYQAVSEARAALDRRIEVRAAEIDPNTLYDDEWWDRSKFLTTVPPPQSTRLR